MWMPCVYQELNVLQTHIHSQLLHQEWWHSQYHLHVSCLWIFCPTWLQHISFSYFIFMSTALSVWTVYKRRQSCCNSCCKTWLNSIPERECGVCLWVGLFQRSFLRDWFFYIYVVSLSLHGHLSGCYLTSVLLLSPSLPALSVCCFVCPLSHCISFSETVIALNKNRLWRP